MRAALLPSITATRPPGCTPFSLRSTARSTWMNADTNPRLPLPSLRRNSKYWPTVSSRSQSRNCVRIAPPLNRPARPLKKKGRSPCGSGPSLGRKRPRRATVTGETLSLPHCSNIHCGAQNSRLGRLHADDFPHQNSVEYAYSTEFWWGKSSAWRRPSLEFCAPQCMLLQCGSERVSPVTVALLGRFLPRLGPLPQGERPFFLPCFLPCPFARYSAAAR